MSEDLIAKAMNARHNAYAKYSQYQVGAAVRGGDLVVTGANIENLSYGATMCAERVAIFGLVAQGIREWTEIAVASADGVTPCGMCRQVMQEFAAPHAVVWVVSEDGQRRQIPFRDLMPEAFVSERVGGGPSQ